jgi:hypothetical protein
LSFITALRKSGCRAPMHEATHRSLNEEFQYEIDLAHEAKLQLAGRRPMLRTAETSPQF